MRFNNLLINHSKTVIDALQQLNDLLKKEKISKPTLFVSDDSNKIIGSLTDGDIRRSLIESKNLEDSLINLCNKEFLYLEETNTYVNFEEYTKKNVEILPVLDSGKRLVKILDINKSKALLPLECIIMAGGRGKRLSPITDSTPKPMIVISGKPILEHIIDNLIKYGIKKFYISVRYLSEKIEEYFGDGSNKEIEIEYIRETTPLGTAGALGLVQNFKSEELLLMNGDILTNMDFEHMYLKMINEKADMILAATDYKVDIPYAVLKTNKDVIEELVEKPSKIYSSNAGIYILKKELIKKIPKNKFYNITDLIIDLIADGQKLISNPIVGYWKDIGDKNELDLAKSILGN